MSAPAYAAAILLRIEEHHPFDAVEIGVGDGSLSVLLATACPMLRLLMVDSFGCDPGYHAWSLDNGDPHGERTAEQVAADRRKAEAAAAAHQGLELLVADSAGAAALVHDRRFDLVFIDADHRQESVARDIAAWWPLVRPGGWIGGHDILRFRDDGVGRAVRDFVVSARLPLHLDRGFTWWVRKPADGEATR
jgi:hypothetical protein